jgi:hypothetical protein
LARIAKNRSFLVIVAVEVDDHGCTVRFHQLRQGEVWIEEDLEGYADDAILLLETPPPNELPSLDGGTRRAGQR